MKLTNWNWAWWKAIIIFVFDQLNNNYITIITISDEINKVKLYAIDMDLKNWFKYNEFAYNKTNSIG